MKLLKVGVVGLGSLALCSCSFSNAIYGPPRVVMGGKFTSSQCTDPTNSREILASQQKTMRGPHDNVNISRSNSYLPQYDYADLTAEFKKQACLSMSHPRDRDLSDAMLESGFTLVKSRCMDFFAEKSGSQNATGISRSLIAPIITILTGLVALRDFQSSSKQQDFLEIISLGGTATIAGLDIYEEHFLFGADNINSVRLLVNSTLSAHRNDVRAREPSNFYEATRHLMDHQMYCTPASILQLTQDAIASSTIKPTNPAIINPKNLVARAQLLGATSSEKLDDGDVAALYWLAKYDPSPKALSVIDAVSPYVSGKYIKNSEDGFVEIMSPDHRDKLNAIFDRFEPFTVQSLDKDIKKADAAIEQNSANVGDIDENGKPLLDIPVFKIKSQNSQSDETSLLEVNGAF